MAKPGPLECDVFEWVSVATKILENENSLTDMDKLKYLRNSLVKDALTTVSSGVIRNPADLIKAISAAYGANHTAEQMWYAFFALRQSKGEHPSAFLMQIQNQVINITRKNPPMFSKPDKSHLPQFLQGLEKAD